MNYLPANVKNRVIAELSTPTSELANKILKIVGWIFCISFTLPGIFIMIFNKNLTIIDYLMIAIFMILGCLSPYIARKITNINKSKINAIKSGNFEIIYRGVVESKMEHIQRYHHTTNPNTTKYYYFNLGTYRNLRPLTPNEGHLLNEGDEAYVISIKNKAYIIQG